jgi:hypothetical protein
MKGYLSRSVVCYIFLEKRFIAENSYNQMTEHRIERKI